MTSEQISKKNYDERDNGFWLRAIAYQLAVANELTVIRNEELKRSVNLQEEHMEETYMRNMTDLSFQGQVLDLGLGDKGLGDKDSD